MRRTLLPLLLTCLLLPGIAAAQTTGNLLRNANFQDDWLTLTPENKNHHWCYSSEFYNRRDFNPDGWTCKGSWQWLNADAPYGQRRLILHGPGAQLTQRVNWVLVHDSRQMGNLADAGGFPSIKPQRSLRAERLVRDLIFRVRLKGKDVPAKAGTIEVGLCPPGQLTIADALGTQTPPTALASVPLPTGTFDWQWVEVKLAAADWLKAAQDAAAKNPKEAADVAKAGLTLPGTARVAIHYQAKEGQVEVERAELVSAGPESPNLLTHGGFDDDDQNELLLPGYPTGWSKPEKYRTFPGRLYYLFNTWHNAASDNRGTVSGDRMVAHSGLRSLRMIVPSGDEVSVSSPVVTLNQKEARLIEVSAWVKTDRLCMLNLDAVDDAGQPLDGFPFIHMAPVSIGTDDWRQVRQVFRPRQPVKTMRLRLCARGTNGFTLDDTGLQPQNNVVGIVWWDDVQVREPESTPAELMVRGVKPIPTPNKFGGRQFTNLDWGERLQGKNVLTCSVFCPFGTKNCWLKLVLISPTGERSEFETAAKAVPKGNTVVYQIPYTLTEACAAYSEYQATLILASGTKEFGEILGWTEARFATWATPLDLELGALYLQPEQKQFVRLNLGLSHATLADVATVRLEVQRRGTGQVLRTWEVPATPAAIAAQRTRIPKDLRDDFSNLLLTDLDVSFLPLQPFGDPQRNWRVRARAIGKDGKFVAESESPPFCRLAHPPKQPPIQSVAIKNNLMYVNGQPWLPWGVVYGHVPVYDGPADPGPGKYLDLHNLPAWSMYDRFTAAPYTRARNDYNCLRYVAGSVTDPKGLEKRWAEDNLYASSVFVVPQPVFSVDELGKGAKGKDRLDAYLKYAKTAPMVVSTAPGIEEAFGTFTAATPGQLKGLAEVVDYLRSATGKPVMVGHGGYWNRLELEKVPFFDIIDPETEPLYPAPLHTDLRPLIKRPDQVIWLRPQMYEDVPFERWRYHVFVELLRGCRGWQIAHGPGDQSLFRGLHGELEFFRPILASEDKGPAVKVEPWLEHWSRRHQGKTYVIAASTRGLTFGRWRWQDADDGKAKAPGRSRVTTDPFALRDEANSYGADQKVGSGPGVHGIQYLPDARTWPAGTKLSVWVRTDAKAAPKNLVVLAKTEGRWVHEASWGKFDVATLRQDLKQSEWFLRTFYRHASGFLGWDSKLVAQALAYVPSQAVEMGKLPAAGEWVQLEVPLDKIGADGKLLDGVAFLHEGGRVQWGPTRLVAPDGTTATVWGDSVGPAPESLKQVRIHVAGLKAGTPIRVLFEDRTLTAQDGFFVDDFRGADLYQRYGGGYGVGYGNGPVALHLYEIAAP
jgi:hypothetical protein